MKKHCAEGNTVFFSSHVLEVVEKLCDRVAVIDKGRIAAVDSVERLRQSESLEQFFLRLTSAEPEKTGEGAL
jgi:ABC-2 type transport system ATP-binding protein